MSFKHYQICVCKSLLVEISWFLWKKFNKIPKNGTLDQNCFMNVIMNRIINVIIYTIIDIILNTMVCQYFS